MIQLESNVGLSSIHLSHGSQLCWQGNWELTTFFGIIWLGNNNKNLWRHPSRKSWKHQTFSRDQVLRLIRWPYNRYGKSIFYRWNCCLGWLTWWIGKQSSSRQECVDDAENILSNNFVDGIEKVGKINDSITCRVIYSNVITIWPEYTVIVKNK